jgi:carbon storage regulator
MLVLTRKIGESIKINEDIKVTVIEIKGKNIRIGIEAPKETKVYREELYLKIKSENELAAVAPKIDLSKVSKLFSSNLKKPN